MRHGRVDGVAGEPGQVPAGHLRHQVRPDHDRGRVRGPHLLPHASRLGGSRGETLPSSGE